MPQFKTQTPHVLGKEFADLYQRVRDLENRRLRPSVPLTAASGLGTMPALDTMMKDGSQIIPFTSRMGYNEFASVEENYFVSWMKPQADGHSASIITLQKAWGPGTYQWIGKTSTPQNHSAAWWGFEYHHGNITDGAVVFQLGWGWPTANLTYSGITAVGGTPGIFDDTKWTRVDLGSQDWTSDTTFKVVWATSYVDFYINGYHDPAWRSTTNIPDVRAGFFMEATSEGNHANPLFAWLRKNSFEQL